mmetsp:Transcript_19643/g.3217  ORF Transcript_19643/g.3217 Transcript_19643/m.3217 type:complete len:99 (+) Transcript_19643:88-384(+)
MIGNMLHEFVGRFNKPSPVILFSNFERSVATEARRIKESLFMKYVDKIQQLESSFPLDIEGCYVEHIDLVFKTMNDFDRLMGSYLEFDDVMSEKENLL